MWLEAQTKKGTHDACHVYTHLWLNLTIGQQHQGNQANSIQRVMVEHKNVMGGVLLLSTIQG